MDKIEELEKRIKQLENKLNKTYQSFGRSYTSVGSSDSDYLIKTKGQVKIQYGNKFIDLIKDGKINIDAKFVFQSDSVGVKDGIYLLPDRTVILKIGDQYLELTSASGTTYVSFMEQQETTSQQKEIALHNIGFIYNDLTDVNKVQNGIIYITSEKALYTITNGIIEKFTVDIPQPYNKQFIIQKNNEFTGALVIRGQGVQNSLAFNYSYIYEDNDSLNIDGNKFKIISNNQQVIEIKQDKTTIYNLLQATNLYSPNASSVSGFRLYVANGESTLEIDNLVVRNGFDISNSNFIYPEEWLYEENIVSKIEQIANTQYNLYSVKLQYSKNYKPGDILYGYSMYNSQTLRGIITFKMKVVQYDLITDTISEPTMLQDNVVGNITIQFFDIVYPDETETYLNWINYIPNTKIFKVNTKQQGISTLTLHRHKNNLDLVESTYISETNNHIEESQKVLASYGILNNLSIIENGSILDKDGNGFYSNLILADEAAYTNNYSIPDNDNSSKFSSTEWVMKHILPSGSIILWGGSINNIPNGWQICDGTNGTPNLIDKIVIGASQEGISGSYNVETSESATTTINWVYLAYIMKI